MSFPAAFISHWMPNCGRELDFLMRGTRHEISRSTKTAINQPKFQSQLNNISSFMSLIRRHRSHFKEELPNADSAVQLNAFVGGATTRHLYRCIGWEKPDNPPYSSFMK